MRKTLVAFGLVLVGVVTGVAGARAVQDFQNARFISTGLFSVAEDEGVNFHVTLDDRRGGPPTVVTLRFFDESGIVVERRQVTLGPNQSSTLQMSKPGRYRAQAEIFEPVLPLSARRVVVSTVEIFDVNDLKQRTRFVCGPGEGVGANRAPD